MKLFLDTCVFGGAVDELRRLGHDVAWSGSLERDPGDEQLLTLAQNEGRIVITLDKDFGELAIVKRVRHHGIIRLVGFRAGEQGAAAQATIERYSSELASGAIVTVERSRIRVRPASD